MSPYPPYPLNSRAMRMLWEQHMAEWAAMELTPERLAQLNQQLLDDAHEGDPPWEE